MPVLTINVGSSSLKAVLFRSQSELVEVRAAAERIGTASTRLQIKDAKGKLLFEQSDRLPDHEAALEALFTWLQSRRLDGGLRAIGQRVVHGGSQYTAPTLITDAVLRDLEALVPLDTEHLPQALRVIRRPTGAEW